MPAPWLADPWLESLHKRNKLDPPCLNNILGAVLT